MILQALIRFGSQSEKRMWLPTPIYERVPHFYLLVGLLFIADGLYLGFEIAYSFFYIALGLACSTYGIVLRVIRQQHRRTHSPGKAAAELLESAPLDSPMPGEQSVA